MDVRMLLLQDSPRNPALHLQQQGVCFDRNNIVLLIFFQDNTMNWVYDIVFNMARPGRGELATWKQMEPKSRIH